MEEDKNDESINPDINPEIIRINNTLSKLVTDAEKAGEAGDYDTAAVSNRMFFVSLLILLLGTHHGAI